MDDFLWIDGAAGTAMPGAAAANEANAKAQNAQTEVAFLAQDVRRLFALTEALWQILREEHGYDDETLRAKVAAVEAAHVHDGTSSGKLEPEPCGKCGRPLARRHPRCMYCGAERKVDVFER